MDHSDKPDSGYERSKAAAQFFGAQRTQRAIAEYAANPKFCPYCGTKIPYEKRRTTFCDHSCAACYNNRGVRRHGKHSNVCECGNRKKSHNKYCAECARKQVYRKLTFEGLKGDRARRTWLLKARGNRCEVCGLSEWMGKPIPIEMDHIDGNSDNNDESNLRLICPNCHAQTETYKGANAGKETSRQKMRRRCYADGQTY